MTGVVVRRDGLREAVDAAAGPIANAHRYMGLTDDEGFCLCAERVGDARGFRLHFTSLLTDALARVLDAVPVVPPTEDEAAALHDACDHESQYCAVKWHATTSPVVPPDPTAVDRTALVAWFHVELGERCDHVARDNARTRYPCEGWTDQLLSSGVLVAVADVRARAWRWAASFGTMPGKSWPETLRHHAEHVADRDRDEPACDWAAHDADVRSAADFERTMRQVQHVLDAVPVVPPTEASSLLRELADLIEPFSGIGLANGATRADVAAWIRHKADEVAAPPVVPPDPPAVDVDARIANLPVCGCGSVAYIHHRACPLRQAVRELVQEIQAGGAA